MASNKSPFITAKFIVRKKCAHRDYSKSSLHSLAWHVRHFYLDKENYPNPFNLRIAKKFEGEELNQYFDQAASYRRRNLYETTVYSEEGEFYFGFHYG